MTQIISNFQNMINLNQKSFRKALRKVKKEEIKDMKVNLIIIQMPHHLICTHMNGLTRFPLSYFTFQLNHSQGNGLGRINEERRPY